MCAEDISFLTCVYQQGLSALRSDGIMGMAPSRQTRGAELLITQLKQQNVIESQEFSFLIGRD